MLGGCRRGPAPRVGSRRAGSCRPEQVQSRDAILDGPRVTISDFCFWRGASRDRGARQAGRVARAWQRKRAEKRGRHGSGVALPVRAEAVQALAALVTALTEVVQALAALVTALTVVVQALAALVTALTEAVQALAAVVTALTEAVQALAALVQALAALVTALAEGVTALRGGVPARTRSYRSYQHAAPWNGRPASESDCAPGAGAVTLMASATRPAQRRAMRTLARRPDRLKSGGRAGATLPIPS